MSGSKISRPLFFGMLATSIAVGTYGYVQHRSKSHNTLYAALSDYGIKTPLQKQAYRYIIKQAGIPNADRFLDEDLASESALTERMIDNISVTQLFLARREPKKDLEGRKGNVERWAIPQAAWMKDPATQPQLIKAAKALSLIDEVAPTPEFSNPDAAVVFGARRSAMKSRLDYLYQQIANNKVKPKLIILLTGERYAEAIDATEEELAKIAAKYGKSPDKLTETDMFRDLFENSPMFGKFPLLVIDTPRGDLIRPTTDKTVADLIKEIETRPDFKDLIFVSSQPHVAYQDEVIAESFYRNNIKLKYLTIGSEYKLSNNGDLSANVSALMSALGTELYAKTPRILRNRNTTITDRGTAEKLISLYESQPMVFQSVEKLFSIKIPANKPK